MPDEEEAPLDTKSPDVINPLKGALEGLTIEEFITRATTPTETPPAAPPAAPPPATPPATPPPTETSPPPPVEQKPEDDIATLLAYDPSDLKTKAGVPVGESSRQRFKTLQSALQAKNDKLAATLQELEKVKANAGPLEERQEYKAILEEKDKLKKEIDLVAFENSDEWKATYTIPIQEETTKVAKLIKDLNLDAEDNASMIKYVRQAEAMFGDPEAESEYTDLLDKISGEYMRDQGKTTRSTKFVSAMEKLFNLHADRAKAYANKEEARQKIVESMGRRSNTAQKALQDRLDIELIAFEKTDIGQIFKKTTDFDFAATSKANREKALAAMRDFQITGQVTNDLADVFRSYALRPAYDKEREFLVQNYIKLGTAVETLLKEKEELQRRVLSLRGEGREVTPSVSSKGNNGKPDWSARGILGENWEKVAFDR